MIYKRLISVGDIFELFDIDDIKKEHPEYWICTEIDIVDNDYLYFGHSSTDRTGIVYNVHVDEYKDIPFKFHPHNRRDREIRTRIKSGHMRNIYSLSAAEFMEIKEFFDKGPDIQLA